MKIVSWNINGLRAATKKGFKRWFRGSGADIIGLQEVRALPEQLEPTIRKPRGWRTYFAPAERKGYSGVALYATKDTAPDAVETTLGVEDVDVEGRFILGQFGDLWVVSGYFPNGNGTVLPNGKRSNDRIPYKLHFYKTLFDRLEAERAAGRPILVMGDFNTAHRPIDLARPRSNRQTSGFTDVERADFDALLARGWTDTFRHVHGDVPDIYSWWSQRFGIRERNVGWRIDYVLASPGAMAHLRDAFIDTHVMGSDHCPVGVEVDRAILGVRRSPPNDQAWVISHAGVRGFAR